MGFEAMLPLIIQYGLPLAEKIWQKATSGKDATQADWDELKAIASETAQYHLDAVRAKLSLGVDDPRILAIAQLIAK